MLKCIKSLSELYQIRCKLREDIRNGIDTEDTWYDLDAVNFWIKESKHIPRDITGQCS